MTDTKRAIPRKKTWGGGREKGEEKKKISRANAVDGGARPTSCSGTDATTAPQVLRSASRAAVLPRIGCCRTFRFSPPAGETQVLFTTGRCSTHKRIGPSDDPFVPSCAAAGLQVQFGAVLAGRTERHCEIARRDTVPPVAFPRPPPSPKPFRSSVPCGG